MNTNPEDVCPIPATHHKFAEAGYFLAMMVEKYHDPWPFLYNFNAFLQANRSITMMLEKEISSFDKEDLKALYKERTSVIGSLSLMKTMNDLRVQTVHKGIIRANSTIFVGHFRGRDTKAAFRLDLDLFISSEALLAAHAKTLAETYLDIEHSAIGEQIGVDRYWRLEELGDKNIVHYCEHAFNILGELVSEFHRILGKKIDIEPANIDIESLQVMLESNCRPELVYEWGWE